MQQLIHIEFGERFITRFGDSFNRSVKCPIQEQRSAAAILRVLLETYIAVCYAHRTDVGSDAQKIGTFA